MTHITANNLKYIKETDIPSNLSLEDKIYIREFITSSNHMVSAPSIMIMSEPLPDIKGCLNIYRYDARGCECCVYRGCCLCCGSCIACGIQMPKSKKTIITNDADMDVILFYDNKEIKLQAYKEMSFTYWVTDAKARTLDGRHVHVFDHGMQKMKWSGCCGKGEDVHIDNITFSSDTII